MIRSEFFESGNGSMAPNSEQSARIRQFPFLEETINKEKQRPPIYNPEDYAISLKKWGRKTPNGAISLYTNSSNSDVLECSRSQSNSFRDYRNPMLTSSGSEMTLRQFGTVSELLAKLKSDLRLAYPSFVQEFVGDPLDGITLLLDLLRAIQLTQSSNGAPGSSSTTGKIPPSVQRRALLDELSCLQCLFNCCLRYSDAVRKLTASSAGLFTLAICIMSNVNKSRILALQLLTKACDPTMNGGHSAVSEALSTLRLRFGEPVRFRFLVGMLTSAGGQKELLSAGMKFLNKFLDTAGTPQKRLYIQAELEQAGFDVAIIKKNIGNNVSAVEQIFEELDHWEQNHIDIETMTIRIDDAERENDSLRDKILLLERKIQILQEEKGILISLEQCLKERCSELQGEVHSLKSDKYPKITSLKKDGSTPAEDEGISSSERSLTPEEDLQRESSVYEMYSIQSKTIQISSNKSHKPLDDEEEETTIDEVIEELRNIINDAETENYAKEARSKEKERKKIEEAQVSGKLHITVDADDYALDDESEIIPANLHPQPPRKARSLVHMFLPAEDYDYCNRELFFENETAYTSEEGSDSLLSASKLGKHTAVPDNRVVLELKDAKVKGKCKRSSSKASIKRSESFRCLPKPLPRSFDGSYYYNTPVVIKQKEDQGKSAWGKSKSLDRIDDGLDSMVDIVVTDQKLPNHTKNPPETHGKMLSRSISNVFATTRQEFRSKLSSHSEEKQRMFLPATQNENGEIPYYFPRLQEKRCSNSSSFLIKRGHTNAGLYSGQIIRDTSLSSLTKTKEYVPVPTCRVTGKVTDLPSGLY